MWEKAHKEIDANEKFNLLAKQSYRSGRFIPSALAVHHYLLSRGEMIIDWKHFWNQYCDECKTKYAYRTMV